MSRNSRKPKTYYNIDRQENYNEEIKCFIKLGKAAIFSIENDWNIYSRDGCIKIKSELETKGSVYSENVTDIPGCGHSLNPRTENAKSQAENAGFVIDKTLYALKKYYLDKD